MEDNLLQTSVSN